MHIDLRGAGTILKFYVSMFPFPVQFFFYLLLVQRLFVDNTIFKKRRTFKDIPGWYELHNILQFGETTFDQKV